MTYLSVSYWLSNGDRGISFCGVGFKFIQEVVDYLYDIHVTIVPVGISSQTSHCCSSQGSQLGMIDFFSLTVVFLALPSIGRDEASRYGPS